MWYLQNPTHNVQMLTLPITQLLNQLFVVKNGSCLLYVALMVVLEAFMSCLSSVVDCHGYQLYGA